MYIYIRNISFNIAIRPNVYMYVYIYIYIYIYIYMWILGVSVEAVCPYGII